MNKLVYNFIRGLKPFGIWIGILVLIMLDIYFSLRNDFIFFVNVGVFILSLIYAIGKERNNK
jgi:hypothetical protein